MTSSAVTLAGFTSPTRGRAISTTTNDTILAAMRLQPAKSTAPVAVLRRG